MDHDDRNERRRRVMAFVEEHVAARGYPPTIVEVAAAVGCAKGTVWNDLKWLRDHAYLEVEPGVARGLRVLASWEDGVYEGPQL